MAIDINFGALQQANPFAAYAQGQEFGKQRAQDAARREAGNVFATDPEKAAAILMGAGDLQGGLTLRKYGQQDRQEKARAAALSKAASGDFQGGQEAALSAGDVETYNAIAGMGKEQRERAKASAEQLAAVGQWVSKLPYEQRRGAIQQQRQLLLDQGLSPEQIDAFDPTDQAIDGFVSQTLGLKGLLERADKDRDFGLKEQQFGETKRHNRVTEGVAQGNLSQRRVEHEERKNQGGYAAPRVLGSTLPEGY